MVMSEVELTLRSKAPASAAEQMSLAVAHAGGYVLTREESASDGNVVRVAMVLRVPSAKLEATLAELRRTGTVLGESRTGQDVTEEYSDTQAELTAKKKLEERLLVVLESAKTVKDMMEVEGELARVRGEADKLAGRARFLENRASLATIHVSIASPEQPAMPVTESVWSRFRNAFDESCNLAVQMAAGLIVMSGAALPLLPPAALAFFLIRRHRRAQKRALLSA